MADDSPFLKAIAENPLDPAPRQVYADWLDEQSRYDEATAERWWTRERLAARARLTALAAECGDTCTAYDERHGYGFEVIDGGYQRVDNRWRPVTYDDLVQAGHNYIDEGDYFTQRGEEGARDLIQGAVAEQYWADWEIVTGRSRDEQRDKRYGLDAPFSCSC